MTQQTIITDEQVQVTKIEFPEIKLSPRDAHKLRGYFGNVFKAHSPLLHNHYEAGGYRHQYPLVQYKVLNKVPTLIALEEGAELITSLFMKMTEIDIDGKCYPVHTKNIRSGREPVGMADELIEYRFETLWMALNQRNHKAYMESDSGGRKKMLKRILIGNILSLYKGLDLFLGKDDRIMVMPDVTEKSTKFKDNTMLAFSGGFTANVHLPDFVGLGKSVSRGFGTVRKDG
jgi:hypothetical protein